MIQASTCRGLRVLGSALTVFHTPMMFGLIFIPDVPVVNLIHSETGQCLTAVKGESSVKSQECNHVTNNADHTQVCALHKFPLMELYSSTSGSMLAFFLAKSLNRSSQI